MCRFRTTAAAAVLCAALALTGCGGGSGTNTDNSAKEGSTGNLMAAENEERDEDWQDHVSYHYFQDPEAGRYALDIIETGAMTAAEGEGGLAYSVVIYRGYGEEKEKSDQSRFLGMLEKEDDSYLYVFLEFPGNSAHIKDSEETYRSVLDYEDMIPAHMEGVNDYTFRPGGKPEKETEE